MRTESRGFPLMANRPIDGWHLTPFQPLYEPMRHRFRRWLREAYQTIDALQIAWGDSRATFESAEIPSRETRLRGDGDFRVFPRDRGAVRSGIGLKITNSKSCRNRT